MYVRQQQSVDHERQIAKGVRDMKREFKELVVNFKQYDYLNSEIT